MNRIKQVRKLRGYSQQRLADELNVNQTAISQWERGTTTPSYALLTKLAQLLEVSSDYLLGLSDDKNIYSWDDSEIMDAVKESLEPLMMNILEIIRKSNAKDQKLIFDILVETKNILSIKDEALRDIFIDLLHQNVCSINNVVNKNKK